MWCYTAVPGERGPCAIGNKGCPLKAVQPGSRSESRGGMISKRSKGDHTDRVNNTNVYLWKTVFKVPYCNIAIKKLL